MVMNVEFTLRDYIYRKIDLDSTSKFNILKRRKLSKGLDNIKIIINDYSIFDLIYGFINLYHKTFCISLSEIVLNDDKVIIFVNDNYIIYFYTRDKRFELESKHSDLESFVVYNNNTLMTSRHRVIWNSMIKILTKLVYNALDREADYERENKHVYSSDIQ